MKGPSEPPAGEAHDNELLEVRQGGDEAARLDPAPDVAPPGWTRRLRGVALDVGPLRRHRDFRLLFFGRAVTFFGTMITFVAIPYQVYDLTDSSFLVGALGAVEFVAILLLAFVGGALADAMDRRRMVRLTEGALTVASLALLANATLWEPRLWVLFVVAFVMAAIEALQRPSLEGMIPRLVDPDELPAAGALSSFRGTAGMLLGPAVAGWLIATSGVGAAYAVDAVTFAVSLVLLSRMRAMPPPPDADRPSVHAVMEGLRYARSRQELLGTYSVDMVAMFFGMPHALFPAIADDLGGAQALGLLYTAPALGAVLATITSGWTGRVHRHGLAIVIAATIWGFGVIGFGLAPTLPLALAALAVAGAADMVSGVFRMTIWNRTPDHLRGRLASIEMLSYTSGPTLGNVEAGAVAALTSPAVSVVSGGVLCVVGVGVTALALPRFRHYDIRVDGTTPRGPQLDPPP